MSFSSKGAIFSGKDEAGGVAQDRGTRCGDRLPTPLPRWVPLGTYPRRLGVNPYGSYGLWSCPGGCGEVPIGPHARLEQGTFSVGTPIPL